MGFLLLYPTGKSAFLGHNWDTIQKSSRNIPSNNDLGYPFFPAALWDTKWGAILTVLVLKSVLCRCWCFRCRWKDVAVEPRMELDGDRIRTATDETGDIWAFTHAVMQYLELRSTRTSPAREPALSGALRPTDERLD